MPSCTPQCASYLVAAFCEDETRTCAHCNYHILPKRCQGSRFAGDPYGLFLSSVVAKRERRKCIVVSVAI